ncbi:MAG: hypothetical protein UR12_C0008G0031 [candidate division TM6 bacterium GW2011_GWF2_30_66]|nr:MAG: hypothetical protein UR12_C0008G0031 [candidate division TM6 bacterium GW2011_GWF2_30_66]
MWPFIRKQNNIVAISINPQYLTCCWLNKETKSNLININSYEKTEFKSLEFENALIFNPTKINLIKFMRNKI